MVDVFHLPYTTTVSPSSASTTIGSLALSSPDKEELLRPAEFFLANSAGGEEDPKPRWSTP